MKPDRMLDVNVLFAALYEEHSDHEKARRFLDSIKKDGWCISPVVFIGVVRLFMTPAVMNGYPREIGDVLDVLRNCLSEKEGGRVVGGALPTDVFLKEVKGFRQITDFYLVGEAFENNAILVTLDKALHARWPKLTKLL